MIDAIRSRDLMLNPIKGPSQRDSSRILEGG